MVLTVGALHPGLLPPSVNSTADHRRVALPEPWVALIADDGVDGVVLPPVAEHVGVIHLRRGIAGH